MKDKIEEKVLCKPLDSVFPDQGSCHPIDQGSVIRSTKSFWKEMTNQAVTRSAAVWMSRRLPVKDKIEEKVLCKPLNSVFPELINFSISEFLDFRISHIAVAKAPPTSAEISKTMSVTRTRPDIERQNWHFYYTLFCQFCLSLPISSDDVPDTARY